MGSRPVPAEPATPTRATRAGRALSQRLAARSPSRALWEDHEVSGRHRPPRLLLTSFPSDNGLSPARSSGRASCRRDSCPSCSSRPRPTPGRARPPFASLRGHCDRPLRGVLAPGFVSLEPAFTSAAGGARRNAGHGILMLKTAGLILSSPGGKAGLRHDPLASNVRPLGFSASFVPCDCPRLLGVVSTSGSPHSPRSPGRPPCAFAWGRPPASGTQLSTVTLVGNVGVTAPWKQPPTNG